LRKFAPDSRVSASDDPCDRQVYRGPSVASDRRSETSFGCLIPTHEFVGMLMCIALSR
jgi:hypothetical protein